MIKRTIILLLTNFSIVLSLTKVSRVIISNNINKLYFYNTKREIFGTYLTFDKNAEFSFLPYEIFSILSNYIIQSDDILCDKSKININNTEYEAFICDKEVSGILKEDILYLLENINFITNKYAIKIPHEMLFILKDGSNYLRFVSSRNVEHIVLDKELIDLMNVEFLNNDNFIIHNKECYSDLEV